MRLLRRAALAGAGLAAYGFLEARSYRLVTHRLQVAPSLPPLRLLHLSDTHLQPRDKSLIRFLRSLPERLGKPPDLVVATGDLIESDASIGPLVELLADFEARWGRFYVLGSHDYFLPKFEAYTKYFTARRAKIRPRPAATGQLEEGLRGAGWIPLTNTTEVLDTERGRIRLCGTDDPYLRRHRTDHIERHAGDALAIGVTHAPDVVSQWALNGFDLALAGHTHGGQVRVPFGGAVVTNSTLPAALAGGPHRIGNMWLHVSPGLGTGPFAPIRFNCRPEASVLELYPGGDPARL